MAILLVAVLLVAGAWLAPRLGIGQSEVTVVVVSEPVGATIALPDGQVLGMAPLRVPVTPGPGGQVALVARKEGWRPQGPVAKPGRAGEEVAFHFQLEREGGGSAHIVTVPPGATVSVDGETRGASPLTIGALDEDREHRIVVSLGGRNVTRSFKVSAGKVTEVRIELEPRSRRGEADRPGVEPGWLVVTSSPTAPLFVDGQPRGETDSGTKLRLSAGRHSVRLQDPLGGPSASFDVQLEPGRTQALEYDWRRDRWTSRAVAEAAPAEP